MPRSPRLLLSQSYYHIMTRGNNRHKVFECDSDYLYYLDLVRKYKINHPFDIYHYCLMPNHVHFSVKTNKASDFSSFMKKINLAYFQHYHQYYGWAGHLWQGRFRSQPIGKDAYFIQCGKYIELNPVRKRIVNKPEDYHWSSYSFYAKGEKNDLITEDMFYSELDNSNVARQEKYAKMIIDDLVVENYLSKIWGSNYQRYHENQKAKYHFSER